MAKPLTHLPLRVQLSVTLNGTERCLTFADVDIPVQIQDSRRGVVEIAVGTDEMNVAIRRALEALDLTTRKQD